MDPLRTRRVSETLREELSELIRFELSDPRVSGVDVTDVIISPDLRKADVLVSLSSSEGSGAVALAGLAHASGFLRAQLMQRLDLYRMPELQFRADAASTPGRPVKALLRRIRRGRPAEDAK